MINLINMFTLGMATYDDYDGVYFTAQSAKLYHEDITEIVIIDNNPNSEHGRACKNLTNWQNSKCPVKYVEYTEKNSSFVKGEVFKHASNDYVIVCDSHVLFSKDSVKSLKDYYLNDHKPYDFIQGPMLYDDLTLYSTHLEQKWRDNFYGIWSTKKTDEKYFEIPAMGMGAFSCKKSEWLGFHPLLKGFGGEEFYIHEKYRKNGGKCICLQDFKWTHRFSRPTGIPFPNILEDRVYNYFIGRFDIGSDYQDIVDHFSSGSLNKGIVKTVFTKAYRDFYQKEPSEEELLF